MKKACLAIALLLLQACAVTLKPTDYDFQEDQIQPFNLSGKLAVINGQPSSERIAVYTYGPTNIYSDLKSLTDLMVRQTLAQAQKRGMAKSGGSEKSIELKILTIKSEAAFFHFNSKMEYQVKLGNGDVFTKKVEHSSGDVKQDVNGCVADGVIDLLQDDKVKAYLAQ